MTPNHGFQIIREQEIKEIKTKARIYRHIKTGAEMLSLINDDENKVFGAIFRTPPKDSTGIAHILEHSVLCGSKKYPVKEPFVELLKGSLNTFLNAFTFPDKTCYPVASQNLQDFYNLVDVYLDAVLYPRLTPHVLQQEGWHYEMENPEGPIFFKGVVFNEMKGAYSSPDSVLSEYSLQSLFPDNTYGLDSGGDPKHIPDLTFEQFMSFHKTYYHPSNARFYFYGDDDPENRLKILDEYLKDYEPVQVDSSITLQPLFQEPRRLVRPFMAGEENEPLKGMITVNWLLPETTDISCNFALRMLNYILLGMPASPLYKALIDSGMGEDFVGEGLGTELRQMYFSAGLKGIRLENADKVETLILKTLTELCQKGIDPKTVEAAINTIEFRLRENNSGSYPRGLLMMLRSLTTWLYDGDPLSLLAFEKPLENFKNEFESNSTLFEEMIRSLFIDNPHRTTLILDPDIGFKQKEQQMENSRLSEVFSRLGTDGKRQLLEDTQILKKLQETPDPPDALASIPVLKLSDLDKNNKTIPLSRLDQQGAQILFHDLFTNGIVYFDLGLNLHMLPEKYLPYGPLFGRALVEMGTEKEDYVSLIQRISRKTGGIHPETMNAGTKSSSLSAAYLFLRGKAMPHQIKDMIHIFRDVLLEVRLDNPERFRQMVLESKARMEQKMVPSGHSVVNLRLRSHFGESHWAAEQMGGVSYLFFLRKLAQDVDENWPRVLNMLQSMRQILVNRNAMILNLTLSKQDLPAFEPHMEALLNSLPASDVALQSWNSDVPSSFEALTIPSLVNYVGKGADIYKQGYQFHGSSMVITRYLRNAWLWDRVRVQGGAYGAFCLFDRFTGVLTLVSYRDPNITRTIDVFDETAGFLDDTKISEAELTKSIIGAIGDLDAHMMPDAKGYASMVRHIMGDTDEDRQQMRDQVLNTRSSDFRDFAQVLGHVRDTGLIKVLGSADAVEKVLEDRPGWLEVVKVL